MQGASRLCDVVVRKSAVGVTACACDYSKAKVLYGSVCVCANGRITMVVAAV